MLIWWPLKSRDTPLVSSLFTFTLELPSLGHLDQRCKVRPAAFYDIRSVQL